MAVVRCRLAFGATLWVNSQSLSWLRQDPGARLIESSQFVAIPTWVRYIVPSLYDRPMLIPKKSLGQNFLQDDNIARKIVKNLHVQRGDHLVEIGPGHGALTRHLRELTDELTVIEIDRRAVEVLRERWGSSLRIVHADVLQVSLTDLRRTMGGRLRVVGNIPYYITSEIVFWLFDQRAYVSDATLMVQWEVARRFIALPKTKEYGILSVFAQYYTKPRLLFKVSRNSFYPRPNVDSALVQFTFKSTLEDGNEELFRRVVRATFGKRRKTLRNGLRCMGLDEPALKKLAFDLTQRPEDLTYQEFLRLTSLVEPLMNSGREVSERSDERYISSQT